MTPERAREALKEMARMMYSAQLMEAEYQGAANAGMDALDAVARVRAFLDRDTISYRIAVNGFDAYRADILRALDGVTP